MAVNIYQDWINAKEEERAATERRRARIQLGEPSAIGDTS
jgi:hypothetical protein